ncbi:succinylglutamate desuccinylase/aspartoacylase family protein [Pseudoduganella plicata]|uniref:Succinylglutamate desuccinylase n=1 Tax=Pseudoduganella plicata TaxID=321984 RepID=A0A4P7B969_9BURK|nr:succinylglutamate desuccinylase/aspartoacylase family protein [Pseudoduganella plicata]QBQ34854.1 succinylglutamate desuccinylase [Pseudoduganella plicata]GGY89075.1 succinylglutamate desuccinylase [Pseudoduganella plicata]
MTATAALQFRSVTYTGLGAGPRLIVTGAVHGNETAGTQGILRVMRQLDSGALTIAAGSVTFVPVTNPLAYAKGERAGERNLNRNLFPTDSPEDFEDRVANWLCPLLAAHDVLLDLHSFNAPGEPFVMVGPRDNDGPLEPFCHEAEERALARVLGVRRFVDGWLRTYGAGVQRRLSGDSRLQTVLRYGVGTTEYMRTTGGYALTLECGQHDDPQAPRVAWQAIMNTLAHLRLIEAPAPMAIARDRMEALSMMEVHDKMHDDDVFTRPWSSFDRVAAGAEIGRRADGTPVLAPYDAMMLFPDTAARANQEWFYLARTVADF